MVQKWVGMTVFKPYVCLWEWQSVTVFAIKRLRQVIAVCERTLCLLSLFSAELKLVLPSSFFVVPPVSFPQGHFSLSPRSQFHCCGNLHFSGQFPCLIITWTSTPEHISEKKGPSPAGFLQILLSGCLFWGGRGRGSECWHRCGCGWCWMAMVGHGICGKINAPVEISTYSTFQCRNNAGIWKFTKAILVPLLIKLWTKYVLVYLQNSSCFYILSQTSV